MRLEGVLGKIRVNRRDDVDVDGRIMIGRRKKIVGFSFATDRRMAVYFDPVLTKIGRSLTKALPGAAQVSFAGASADGSKMVVGTWSDTNPGVYYHFNRTTNEIRPLVSARPDLEKYALADVKSVTVTAADGTLIPA